MEESALCAINFTVDKETNSINTMCKCNSFAEAPDTQEPLHKCLKLYSCVLHMGRGQDHAVKQLITIFYPLF